MKLLTIFLFAACLQVCASGNAQRITLSGKSMSLEKAFREIKKQTGYSFLYSSEVLRQSAHPVDLSLRDATLEEALRACLNSQPFTYEIDDKTIIIKPKAIESPWEIPALLPPPVDVTVVVLDSTGRPLEGASVLVKGTKRGIPTDVHGRAVLKGMATVNTVLVVSFTGYVTQEVKLSNSLAVVHLQPSTSELDQVQIIAFGTESRRFSVGAVSTVNAEDIEKQPVTNLLLALQGQAPGLAINATSGVPGSQVLVQVRGQNTLASSQYSQKPYDQPLFIIDGVPFASQNRNVSQLSSLANAQSYTGGISQGGGISPFNNINPADIESISILKDADATSIYGTQGSNGVIIITTKKGKPGKTTFDFNINTGFNSDARPLKLLNTQQYLQFRKDAFAADGVTPTNDPNDYLGYAPDLTIFDQSKYTNWEKIINEKTTNNTDVHASVSGGSVNNTFLVSVGYSKSDYNFPGDFADQRFTLHSALHSTSLDKRFTLDLITDYGYDQNNSPGYGGSQNVLLAPNLPDLLDGKGNLIWTYQSVDLSNYQFYSYLKQPTNLQNYNLNSSLHLSYQILKGLTIGVDLGYNRNTTAENAQYPAAAQSPLYAPYITSTFANNVFQTINIEPQLNYTKSIGKGVLSALLGSTYKKNTNNSTEIEGAGYTNDNSLGSINGASDVYASDGSDIYRYSAAFARLKYIYDQKYIIDFTGRRDGSSYFGPGHQFGNFGSVGAGWIFSEEKVVKNILWFLSYGKLSGSYGTTGSDGIKSYQYQTFYKPITNVPTFQGTKPNAPGNLYNPDYSWALKKSLNVALDLGLFNNRLLLNATYYRDREGNQLIGYQLPIQSGFASVLGNLDANIQNQGWEFSATATPIKTKDFTWTTNLNLTFNRNKLLSFPNLATSTYSSNYRIGQPTSLIFGFKYKDVNPTTGLFEFYDKNGNVTSNPKYGTAVTGGDQVPIANREVNYMGGFGNNFIYKNFGLYVFCQFSSGNAPNYLYGAYDLSSPGLMGNEPLAIFNNYWKTPGDNATLQRLSSSYSSSAIGSAQRFAESTGAYGNDTYLRVKTVALFYALPAVFLKKVNIHGAKIYVNAQNLFTITNYKVGDPEQPGFFNSFPLQRTIALGLNLNF